MKKLLLYCFILYSISSSLYSEIRLSVKNEVFNFGTIVEGINVPVSFEIINSGTETVHIEQIRTFSSCVETHPIEKKKLKPGENLRLDYIFESLGYGGVLINKKIELYYKGSNKPLVLRVKGSVLPLKPYQAPLGEMTYNFFILIDVRSPKLFRKEHIIGAINIPSETIFEWIERFSNSLSEDMIIYLYSDDTAESTRIAKLLHKKGYKQFISLVGGLNEWKKLHGSKWIISGNR